jgi:flavodoxin
MKALVVYDSEFGNTEIVARAIGEVLGSEGEVEVRRVSDVQPEGFEGLDVLVVGSPTQQFNPTKATSSFLKGIPRNDLSGIKVAAFDTRLTVEEIEETAILAFFVRIFGYAAKPIGNALKKKGGELAIPPEGFLVKGMKGPLVEGELERAEAWAREIIATK